MAALAMMQQVMRRGANVATNVFVSGRRAFSSSDAISRSPTLGDGARRQLLTQRVLSALRRKALGPSAFAKPMPVHSSQQSWDEAWQVQRQQKTIDPCVKATLALEIAEKLQRVADAAQDLTADRSIRIVESPASYGQPEGGVQKGAEMMAGDLGGDGGFIDQHHLSLSPTYQRDGGDIAKSDPAMKAPVDPVGSGEGSVPLKCPRLVGGMNEAVYTNVKYALAPHQTSDGAKDPKFVFNFGGDHSVAIGSCLAAIEAAGGPEKIGILWVDAHADINAPTTSPSGNIHGMPIAWFANLEKLATGVSMSNYPGWEWLAGKVPEESAGINAVLENIVYVGLRDVDAEEQALIDGRYDPMPIKKMKQFSAKDVVELGIERVMAESLDYFESRGVKQIWCSYDIDAVNPAWVPCTGTDVDGGLSLYDALYIPLALAKDGRIVGYDTVELNPEISEKMHGVTLSRKVCELVNLAAVGRPATNTELEEVLEAAHVYDTRRFATLVQQYELSGVMLPENHAQVSVVGLAQHLEATQIRNHFRRKTGLDSGKLKEAGQLRTAWRSLRELEEKNFDQLVRSAFDMADRDGDKRITLAERKWLLAAVSNDLGAGGPSWWPRDGQWPDWWPESW